MLILKGVNAEKNAIKKTHAQKTRLEGADAEKKVLIVLWENSENGK